MGGGLRCFFGNEITIGIVSEFSVVGRSDDLVEIIKSKVSTVARESVVK